ncbi:hypothetical protein BGW38_005418 [Lunasporangiospora selenospora]|uniref:Uncharacterized protein n=1 Tax=Lunasporangiospora selenospora TaxID=979761 RepID=A0A9P6FPZ9_9FUNG|nr:hypothetical protein BGW38_005418 [Lunasporangiospora selenospora]
MSPGGSAFSGASPPSTQMGSLSTMTDFMRNQTSREQSHARSDETAPIQRDGDFTSLDLHHRSTEPLSSTWQQHSLPDRREPDDRINFRLLGNVYFSTWARQSLGDADNDYNMNSQSESEVQPRDPRTDRALAMLGDDRADTDEIMSENEGDGFGPSQSLRQRVAHESNREERGRFGYEESSGDEIDDDDDGIDLVIEERRHRGSNSAGTSNEPGSPSTPAPSHLERPQHAQLSPRSAAVLTSVLSSRRSLWSQSITNSSLTPSLLAQARQHARQYEGNPHFRRTPFPLNLQSPSSLSRPDLRSLGSRVYLSHEAQRAADSECLVDAESGLDPWLIEPGSVSTQYETIQYACGGLDLGSHLVDPNSCSENGFTRDLGRQDVWPLKFDMYFADGGEFNASHSVENVLKNDSSVYW